MALGGGTFVAQNKTLPGAYINVISASAASSALGERGIVAMALDLDWGLDDELFVLTRADFQRKSKELLGYDFGHEKLKGLRDLFLNTHTLITYKLTSGGVKAQNDIAVALHGGTRGNDIQIQIVTSVDVDGEFKVITLLDNQPVDEQIVSDAKDLVPNAYVSFKEGYTLSANAGLPLAGGTNGDVSNGAHQSFLDKAESQQFNALAVATEDETLNNLYATYTERMRDERGQKFQAVLFNTPANYEGVVNVKNVVEGDNPAGLVYWVAGVIGGKPVNESALNDIYDGEYDVDVDFTQTELEQAIKAGQFTMHQVGFDIRVLSDINSLVSTTATKGDVFKDNQTIRIVDQKANDIAALFSNKYLGVVPNDQSGRVSLQNDIDNLNQQLLDIRALESFESAVVEQGIDKKSVVVNDATVIVNTMEKLYMTTVVQ